jgi:hypothetical protein
VLFLYANFKYVKNLARDVLLPEDLEVLNNSESGRKYTHSKAREKLTARRDNYFIQKCDYVL